MYWYVYTNRQFTKVKNKNEFRNKKISFDSC